MRGKKSRPGDTVSGRSSYERRLGSVATTAGVLYALPSVVSAAIIHFSGTPVSIDAKAPENPVDSDPGTPEIQFDTSVLWDVDGGGTADFVLRRTGTATTSVYTSDGATFKNRYASGYLFLDSGANGNGIVMANNELDPKAIKALQGSIEIGPGLVAPTNTTAPYAFGTAGQTGRRMMSFDSSSTASGYAQSDASVVGQAYNGGFQPDQLELFGFSFNEGGDTFFGWAKILHDTQGNDRRLEIIEWAYEDTPDTGIQLGATAIPVPAHGLAMLAAGAGSLLGLRRKRRDDPSRPAGDEIDRS